MSFIDKLRSGELADARTILQAEPGLAQFREDNGVSAVLIARYLGHSDFAREIADAHPGIDLWEAAALGDTRRTAELVDAGADVGAINVDGYTPLGLAVYFGHLEEARLLLDAGADPNVISVNDMAVMPIHSALAGGHKEIASLLLARGAEPDEPTGSDWTPLHYVAESNDIETARILIDAGARSGYARNDGKTALEVAEDNGFRDLARLLAESVA
jgi:ankyrin repeat protein